MIRKTRLARGEGSKKRERLSREFNGSSRAEVREMLSGVPNERLRKYAGISQREALANPMMGLIKDEAQKEVQRRVGLTSAWQKGKEPPAGALPPKKPILRRVREAVGKGVGLLRKGAAEYEKLVSGEAAREVGETLATVGMSPEAKKKFIEESRKHEAEEAAAEAREEEEVRRMMYGEPEPEEAPAPVRRERPAPAREGEPTGVTIHVHAGKEPEVREYKPSYAEEEEVVAEEEIFDEGDDTARDWAEIDKDREDVARDMEDVGREFADVDREIAETKREIAHVESSRGELDEADAARELERERAELSGAPRRKVRR